MTVLILQRRELRPSVVKRSPKATQLGGGEARPETQAAWPGDESATHFQHTAALSNWTGQAAQAADR